VNLPHVGHEVVVSFLEGDPDRPLVTGRVYNCENAKAMGMPENKTQSGLTHQSVIKTTFLLYEVGVDAMQAA